MSPHTGTFLWHVRFPRRLVSAPIWRPLALTVQGESIALGSNALAVIDTKFRHIAGPATAVEAIYAQIPGSHPSVDGLAGYYEYRTLRKPMWESQLNPFSACSTTVNVTFSFGGATWAMAPADFLSQRRSPSRCVGVFYGTTSTGLGLSWVIGSAFLVSLLHMLHVWVLTSCRKTCTVSSATTPPQSGLLHSRTLL